MDIKSKAHMMKLSSNRMAASSLNMRHDALLRVKESLEKNKAEIFFENEKDLKKAREDGISEAVFKRLKFDEKKLATVKNGIEELISLPDPVGRVSYEHKLEDGLMLKRVSCPIGVLGVIFEARPDAMVQIASLCIKSGNCAILKGGRETTETNRILFKLIYNYALRVKIIPVKVYKTVRGIPVFKKALLFEHGANKFSSGVVSEKLIIAFSSKGSAAAG